MMRYTLAFLIVVIAGCAGPSGHIRPGDPSKLSIGMDKQEVIRLLGRPENVSASGEAETLSYILERPWWQDRPFQIKLIKGKVESFGVIESGPPRVDVDVKVQQQQPQK